MSQVFFNEIHYENIGFDKNEGVEIAGPAGTVLDGWRLSVYDGKGQHHGDLAIRGLIPDEKNGFGVVYISVALPNAKGGHGLALVNKSNDVVDFISWNTVVDATGGPASGKKSFKIPVHEDVFTRASHSLQLAGEGNKSSDFKWQAARSNSFGKINAGQTFVKAPKPAQPPVEPTSPPPEPRPSPGPVTPQVLQGLDLLVEKNRREHRTDKFHAADYFAVRRGQIFEVALEAPAPVTQALIKFTVYPETNQHTTVQVSTSEAGNKETEWFAFFAGAAGGKTVVAISIPGRATVGQYTISASGDNGKTWTPPQPCYILFNAWSKFDDVFLDNEAERAEYVLGEDGYIWVGSYFNFGPRPWSFSQFNSKSLQAALALLQKIPLANRGDIVLVSRALSALMNSQDDRGVIVGNWSSDYSGGKSPSSWTGSADILKQYLSTGAPVKFGQCWVYSGTLTTVCRALGIPCRPVTNFASAHDVPDPKYNRSVDKYFLADGVTEDTEKTNDSVWNFHVWNDAWMARRDLGSSAYTGWQAIDGTPQEISGGKYQMGPVPLIAVKHGEKNINYDLEFVFSEVNADEKYYVADGRGGYRLVRTITDSIGLYTSTKAVGSSARNDITLEYKYKEKSPEERASHSADKSGDVKVILSVDQTTKLGKTIQAKLSATATSKESTLRIQFTAGIVTYTGKPVVTLESKTVTVKAAPGTPVNVPFELTPERYVPQLKGTNGILFRAFVWVQETEQATVVQEEFDFVADDIEIELPAANTLVAGRDVNVTVKFTNPLPITLTNLDLTVEGTDLTKVQHFKFAEVKPGQTLSQVVPLYLWKSGKKLLIAMLDSAQINDLRGHIELIVN